MFPYSYRNKQGKPLMRKSYLFLLLSVAVMLTLSGCYKQEATEFYMKNPEAVPQKQNATQPQTAPAQAQPQAEAPQQAATPAEQPMPEMGYGAGPSVPDTGGYIPHAVGRETGGPPIPSGGTAQGTEGVTPGAAQANPGTTATQLGRAAPRGTGTKKSESNTPK
jgi:hypothetical protein